MPKQRQPYDRQPKQQQQQQLKRPKGQQQQPQPKRKQRRPQQQRPEQQHSALGGTVASAADLTSVSQKVHLNAAKTIDPWARLAHLEHMQQETQSKQGHSLPREAIVQIQQQKLEAIFQNSLHKFSAAPRVQQHQQSPDEMSVDGTVFVAREKQQIERIPHNDPNDHGALLAAFNRQQQQIDRTIEGMAKMQSADLANT